MEIATIKWVNKTRYAIDVPYLDKNGRPFKVLKLELEDGRQATGICGAWNEDECMAATEHGHASTGERVRVEVSTNDKGFLNAEWVAWNKAESPPPEPEEEDDLPF